MVEGREGVIGAGISEADSEDRWFPLALNHSATPALVFIFNEINNSLQPVGFEPTHHR